MSICMMVLKVLKLVGCVIVYKNENNFGIQDVKYNEVEIFDFWNGMIYDMEMNFIDGVINQIRVYVKNLIYDYKVWVEFVFKSVIISSVVVESLNKGVCFVVFIVQIFGDNVIIEVFDEEVLLEFINSFELSIYCGKCFDVYLCSYKVFYCKVYYIRLVVWDFVLMEIVMMFWMFILQK